MGTILHLSDFHLCDESGWDYSKSKLASLKKCLKDEEIKYLVYTGDVIDAESIYKSIRDKLKSDGCDFSNYKNIYEFESALEENSWDLSIEEIETLKKEYDKNLSEEYKEAFEKAKKFFKALCKDLKIERGNVIVCPGNHDVMKFLGSEKVICQPGENKGVKKKIIEEYSKVAEYFNDFCDDLGFKGANQNEIYEFDDICFFSVSSNYPVENIYDSEKSCINCEQIGRKIVELSELRKKEKPIVTIVHEPLEGICENINYDYPKGETDRTVTLVQRIEGVSDILLNGDKHSTREKNVDGTKTIVCGNKLTSDYIQYKHLKVGEKNENKYFFNSQNIVYCQLTWKIVPSIEICDTLYGMSNEYIKELSFKFLCSDSLTSQELKELKMFENLRKNIKEERLKLTSNFFCCGIHPYPRDLALSSSSGYDISSGIKSIYDIIQRELDERNEFLILGNPGVGKSTLLGTFYIKALLDFVDGRSDFMPFYFNVLFQKEKKGVTPSNKMDFYENMKEKINVFLEKSYSYASEKKITPLIIFDGLSKKQLWVDETEQESIEEFALELIDRLDDTYTKDFACRPKHVFGVDEFSDLEHPVCGDLIRRELSGIRLDGVIVSLMPRYKDRLKNMVEAYFKLFSITGISVEEFTEKCKDCRVIDLDYHFLEANIASIIRGKADELAVATLLSKKTKKLFEGQTTYSKMEWCAYEIEVNRKNYCKCCEEYKKGSIDYMDFSIVKDKPDVRKFLMAHYLKNVLTTETSKKDYKLEKLNIFIDRKVMTYLRFLLKLSNNGELVNNRCNKVRDAKKPIEGILLCNLAYLQSDCQENGLKLFDSIKTPDDESVFVEKLKVHAKEMARIFAETSSNPLSSCSYIEKLIQDAECREFVRRYQRVYYGDPLRS